MGRAASIGWFAVVLYLLVSAYEIYRLFRPTLTPRTPNEHIFHPAWSNDPQTTERYGWRMCLSESANEITQTSLEKNCIAERYDLQLNDTLALRMNISLPSQYLQPFIEKQEAYARLHEEYVLATAQLAQVKAERSSQAGRPKDPSQIGSTMSNLSSASLRLDAIKESLQKMKKQLLGKSLHLHSFFFKVDNNSRRNPSAMLSDPNLVHTSSPLIQRWITNVNHTRNLISGINENEPQAVTGETKPVLNDPVLDSVSTHLAASAPKLATDAVAKPSTQLIYHLRTKFGFQFIAEHLSFPVSAIPPDLAQHFPHAHSRGKKPSTYPPIIATQDFFTLKRHWLPLNKTFVELVAAEEKEAATAGATKPGHYVTPDGDTVFSTTPAATVGVSDAEDKAALAKAALTQARSYTSAGVTLQMAIDASSLGWYRLLNQLSQSSDLLTSLSDTMEEIQREAQQAAGEPALVDETPHSTTHQRQLQKDAALHSSLLTHSGLNENTDGSETEEMKLMFLDTNPWLLLITFLVAVIHLLFDFLAMKNDVQHWRSRKNDYVGISARSIWISTGVRTLIFLYLVDQETSRMVLLSVGLSLAINYWKSIKLLRITLGFNNKFPYILSFGELPKTESATSEYDTKAMKMLGWASIPFIVGASIYSLLYQTHKSWYSWILSSVASAVYAGGFILMTPQLFINYKLKSVAHLPMRAFVYRACNTFIDDLFAFVIHMPTMHRLACFRDDIIFFIYLYQRWIYPVDHTRTVALDDDGEEIELERKKTEAATTTTDATASSSSAVESSTKSDIELASSSAPSSPDDSNSITSTESTPPVIITDSTSSDSTSSSSSTDSTTATTDETEPTITDSAALADATLIRRHQANASTADENTTSAE